MRIVHYWKLISFKQKFALALLLFYNVVCMVEIEIVNTHRVFISTLVTVVLSYTNTSRERERERCRRSRAYIITITFGKHRNRN